MMRTVDCMRKRTPSGPYRIPFPVRARFHLSRKSASEPFVDPSASFEPSVFDEYLVEREYG